MSQQQRANSDRGQDVRVDGQDQGRVIVRGNGSDPTKALTNQR